MKMPLGFSFWTTLLMMMTQGAFGQLINPNEPPTTNTWTGADPSGYWSAPANWSPAGVPVNGNDLVFPGGLPPGDMVSTNDLTASFFRSITFGLGSRHTIRGNPITLTNRSECIINRGTNVIACDLTFSGTPSTPTFGAFSIRGVPGSFGTSTELTLIGNVGGGSLYVIGERLVIRGQFPGGSLRQYGGTLAFYGDYPHAVSVEFQGDSSTLFVQGSQPNLNITMLWEMESAACPHLSGDGVVGDVTGCGYITPDSTLSVKNVGRGVSPTAYWNVLNIHLNGTNVGEYGRLVASGDVSLSGGGLFPSAGFNPQAGQIFTIVEKTSPGPIANAFLGPEGTVTTLNGMPFRISYVGGDGNDVTLTAQPTNTPPVVTWLQPGDGSTFPGGSPILLSARATDSEGTVSFVEFFADNSRLAKIFMGSSNVYSFIWTSASAGIHRLHAEAVDNVGGRGISGSVQIVVTTAPPVVTLVQPINNGTYPAGNPILLKARATDPDGTVSFVDFFVDSNNLARVFTCNAALTTGCGSNNIYNFVWSNPPLGTFRLHAEAVDNVEARSISDPVQITVGGTNQPPPTNTPPVVTWVQPTNGATFPVGSSISLQARATDFDGTVSFVDFFATPSNGPPINVGRGTLATSEGLYLKGWTSPSAGQYWLHAEAVDDVGARSISDSVQMRVSVVGAFSDANWSPLGSGLGANPGWTATVEAVAVSGNSVYAGGFFHMAGGSPANKIAKWNGTNWDALGGGVSAPFDLEGKVATVDALAVSGGDLYAGGWFKSAGGSPATNVAKWNGSSWSPLGSGVAVGYQNVYALAVSGGDLYAGGALTMAGGSPANRIAKWDGSSWSTLGSGMNGGPVYALAVSGNDLYAGGAFTTAGGSPANQIAKWDGSSWSRLGSAMNHWVHALAVLASDLYVAGQFTTAGGTPANYIAKWNGSSWSPLGSGMNGPVYALAVSGSDLYAGGTFTTAGGSPANRIAKWDGNSWSVLGSGVNGNVFALAVSGSDLYVGGGFTTAGSSPANRIAKARIGSAAKSITASGSSATIQFSGVVGYEYHVQRTDSLNPPMTWTTLTASPLSPADDGSFSFTDTTAPPGTAYYRLVQH